jgi:hypothetical protein
LNLAIIFIFTSNFLVKNQNPLKNGREEDGIHAGRRAKHGGQRGLGAVHQVNNPRGCSRGGEQVAQGGQRFIYLLFQNAIFFFDSKKFIL